MESSNNKHQWDLLANVSDYTKSSKGFQSDEKLDDNDLEVAMINESFEEQLNNIPHFPGPKLDDTSEHNMEVSSPIASLSPQIAAPSDKEFDLGLQLDKELERMLWDGEDEWYRLSFASPVPSSNGNCFSDHMARQSGTLFSLASPNICSSLVSPPEDEQTSDSDAAAKTIAYDVVSSLFDGEPLYSSESLSDDEESEVVNASILQVLKDDETESEFDEENTEAMTEHGSGECVWKRSDSDEFRPTLASRDSPMSAILSPMYSTDEQTVPVSWEELGDSPITAEKVYSEAKAVLRKIRAERKATQL